MTAQPPDEAWVIDRLREMAALLPVLEDPAFEFGRWEPSRRIDGGAYTMPYYVFSPAAERLLAAAPVWMGFAWPEWMGTDEARRLFADQAEVGRATPHELLKMLTALKRSERFGDGSLENAFRSGLLRAIVRRAAELTAP